MKKHLLHKLGLVLLVFTTFCIHSFAQELEQDCINAIPICQDFYSQVNSYVGEGFVEDEINSSNSCLSSGERNDVWYVFTVSESGDLSFSITPYDLSDDYDWAVYNLTEASCEDIYDDPSLEVSCNYAADAGVTGATGATNQTSGNAGSDNQNDLIPVIEGETYVINVSNFSSTQSGYSIDLSNTSATILDAIPPTILNISGSPIEPFIIDCGDNSFYVTFSEYILCDSLNLEDVSLDGPNISYTPTEVIGNECDEMQTTVDIDRDRVFLIEFSEPFTESGLYTFRVTSPPGSPSVLDLCGNVISTAGTDSLNLIWSFIIPEIPFVGDFTDQRICSQGQVNIELTNTNNNSIYTWYDDNGFDPGNEINTGLEFDPDGFLSATSNLTTFYMVEQKSNGCYSIPAPVNVEIVPPPAPDFDFVIDCDDVEVQFSNLTSFDATFGNPTYKWSFGDGSGNESGQESPNYSFDVPGSYVVTLTASYGLGCEQVEMIQNVVIPESTDPVFQVDGAVCNRATVTAQGVYDSYTWDWGDGIVESGTANETHVYDGDGDYEVTLTVSENFPDANCNIDGSSSQMVSLTSDPPEPVFTLDGIGCEPLEILANCTETADVYEWDWGDGNTSTGNPSSHVYEAGGSYDVQLRVVSNFTDCDYENSGAQMVEVQSLPVVQEVVLSHEEAFSNQPVTISFNTDEARDFINFWELSDGTTSSELSFEHRFSAIGTYDVCVHIETPDLGCASEQVCNTIEILSNLWIDVPTAFSPNGDGLNDELIVEGRGVRSFHLQVYNRWGELVFETIDMGLGWNGLLNGKEHELDVFLYSLEAEFVDDAIFSKQGNISLLR